MASKPSPTLEVEKFARWFHQDFGVLFADVETGVATYIHSLDGEQKKALKLELTELLDDFPGKDEKGLRNAWARYGAHWWDRDTSLRESIRDWIASL